MKVEDIIFREATASASAIAKHLESVAGICDTLASSGIDLHRYAEKLAAHAVTFEAWQCDLLAGLVAAYLNDTATRIGYVTNVSVLEHLARDGIASALLRMCLESARAADFVAVRLEVSRGNAEAIALYRKFGFRDVDSRGEMAFMQLSL